MRYFNVYFEKRFVATVIADSTESAFNAMIERGYHSADVADMNIVDKGVCGRIQAIQKEQAFGRLINTNLK